MRNRFARHLVLAGMIALLAGANIAWAGFVPQPNPTLPPTDGVYRTAAQVHAEFEDAALKIVLEQPIHKPFADRVDRTRSANGIDEIELIQNTSLRGNVTVFDKGTNDTLGPFDVELTGPMTVRILGYATGQLGTFQTEIISMSLTGPNPLSPSMPPLIVELTHDPGSGLQIPSSGQTTIRAGGGGGGGAYDIDSFFDVFTELSLDGGQSWMPGTTTRMNLVPEPGTFALLAVGLLGLLGYFWRRKRAA